MAIFVGQEIILLVCQTQKDTLTNQSYNTLGGVSIGLIFLLVTFSLIRAGYNGFMLYKEYQYKDKHDRVHEKQAQYMRQDPYYGSGDN